MNTQKPITDVLIKPAGPDCNLACDYCFYLSKSELFDSKVPYRMDMATLKELTRQVLAQDTEFVNFIWQGGEPTLMGLPFFQQALEFQEYYNRGQKIGNALQTNGVLIDSDWAVFLKKNNFLVGLSLDGPAHIHNRYRLDKANKSSHEKVLKAAELMLLRDVAVNALVVVNDFSVQFPEEIYEYHKKLGLTFMQFIPCVERDSGGNENLASFTVPVAKYAAFLSKLFDLWSADIIDGIEMTSVRFFDSVFRKYVNLDPGDCTLLANCGTYLTVEHDGSVYSCDFYVDSEHYLGNIWESSLRSMFNSELQLRFGSEKSNLSKECLDCVWLNMCRGGCPKDRFFNADGGNLNYLCDAYKIFFEYTQERFEELTEEWFEQQRILTRREQTLFDIKRQGSSIGRNDPCPCGSGKKFKKCCAI